MLDGNEKQLQIKSSRKGYDEAKVEYPNIPCIIVEDRLITEELAMRILGVLQ